MLWWRHEHGAVKFPKTWRGTLGYRPKIHHFFFSHKWDTRFKYLSKLCPYILMYSALHIMQWFSHSLDVFTPKIKRKFFDFYILWIKTNVAYTRLEMIARTKYCTTTTASNWFVTLYYKLLPAVRSSSKHGRWRSSLLLYSISMAPHITTKEKTNSTAPSPIDPVLTVQPDHCYIFFSLKNTFNNYFINYHNIIHLSLVRRTR